MEKHLKTCLLQFIAAGFFYTGFICAMSTHAHAQSLDPIITFDQSHELVEETQDIPMVQVFANGKVKVNRRASMRNPGQFVLNLSEGELAELIALAQASELVDFDQPAAKRLRSLSDINTVVSDSTTTTLQFNRLQNSGALAAEEVLVPTETQTLQLDDVVSIAEAIPDDPGVQAVKALHTKMIELFSKAGA